MLVGRALHVTMTMPVNVPAFAVFPWPASHTRMSGPLLSHEKHHYSVREYKYMKVHIDLREAGLDKCIRYSLSGWPRFSIIVHIQVSFPGLSLHGYLSLCINPLSKECIKG